MIQEATAQEKRDYLELCKPLYPLYGSVVVDGKRCHIEDLRDQPGGRSSDPQFEIMPPSLAEKEAHFKFSDGSHTLLCFDLDDLRERVQYNTVERCTCTDWRE